MNGMLEKLLRRTRNHWRRQKAIRQLSALSDRTLKDIGLHRSGIPSVAEDQATNRDKSRVRFTGNTTPVVAPINATKSSTDHDTQRDAA